MKSILEYSNKQKERAERILKDTDILNQLKSFGKLTIVGSFFNNTMIKPDIDLVIKVESYRKVKETISFLKEYFEKSSKFFEIWVEDRKSLFGKSIHARYKDGLEWKFDILVVTIVNKKDLKLSAKIRKATQNKEIRRNISTLKYHFYKRKLRLNGLSMHIYDAVIENKITNTKDFMKYLKLKGIKMADFKK